MTQIEKTKDKLEALFKNSGFQNGSELPNEFRVLLLFTYAKNYFLAAEIVEKEASYLFMQSLHLLGQSMELALKAFILACNEQPKEIHDLVKLTTKAENLGLTLVQIENSSIVLLNHYFFQDLSTQTKFKTRYPAKAQEMSGGPIPDQKVLKGIFDKLVSQANTKCVNIDLLTYI
jgi:hypothetical protein